jgi:hypothetical protein
MACALRNAFAKTDMTHLLYLGLTVITALCGLTVKPGV